jgi:hypothetical protein
VLELSLVVALSIGDTPVPVTSRDAIYELSEVRPGDRGVGYTVYQGDQVEPFDVEVLGIMEDMLGPGEDVILTRLSGARIEFTGVISGMSGSPVFIDDRLVGAVAYRFGQFSKEPIAGITPIRRMLAADAFPGRPPAPPARAVVSLAGGLTPRDLRGRGRLDAIGVPMSAAVGGGAEPIAAPLATQGLRPAAAARLAEHLRGWTSVGPVTTAFGAGAAAAPAPADGRPAAGNGAGRVPALPIVPAAPIAALLVKGDIKIAAIGTVTYVDDDQVLAFGHPFVGFGPVSYPLATASILNTLASEAGSYKQGIAAREVGVISQDRLTAITGRLGAMARTVPVTVTLTKAGLSRPHVTQVEIVDDPVWLPIMVESVVATAISGRLDDAPGGTVDVRARLSLTDRGLTLEDRFSIPAPASVAAFAARDVASAVGILARNDIAPVRFDSIDVEARVGSEVQMLSIRDVQPDTWSVRPGSRLGLSVHMMSYRGEPVVKRVEVPIPARACPELELFVGGAQEREARLNGRRFPRSLDDLLGLLAERRSSDRIYVERLSSKGAVIVPGERFDAPPPSIQPLLNAQRPSRRVDDAHGRGVSVSMPGVVQGSVKLELQCRGAWSP